MKRSSTSDSETKSPLDFDSVLAQVGDFGRYQAIVYLLICIPASFPSAWTAFNQVLTAATPEHHCRIPGVDNAEHRSALMSIDAGINCSLLPPLQQNEAGNNNNNNRQQQQPSRCFQYDVNYSQILSSSNNGKLIEWCHNTNSSQLKLIPCQNGYEFDRTTYDETIVTEFNLVCDRSSMPAIASMMFYIGSFIGNILFGYIADRWGRRASFFTILAVQVAFGTANAFNTDILSFTCLRFVVGLTFPALYQVSFVIGMELMGPSGRMYAGIMVCVVFGFAMCLLGIVAAYLRHWSSIILISNAPYALLFVYWWSILPPPSPRWLVIMQRYDEAEALLLKIAHWNRKPIPAPGVLQRQCELVGQKAALLSEDERRHNILDLFRTPNLRKNTVIITFVWLVNAVVYNGLTYNISNLGVNDYVSFSINGAIEIPAYFIIWPLLDRYGRRWPLTISMLIGGASCISCMFVAADNPWVISGLAFTGKFGIAASFAIIYLFAGELYPTVVRAFGMGFSSMVAGSGLIVAPYLVYLAVYARILPLLLMGILTVAAGIASMFLPETLGAPLPQTVDEAEEFGKHFSFFYCPSSNSGQRKKIDKQQPENINGGAHCDHALLSIEDQQDE